MHVLPSFSDSVSPKARHVKQNGRSERRKKCEEVIVFMVVGIGMEKVKRRMKRNGRLKEEEGVKKGSGKTIKSDQRVN